MDKVIFSIAVLLFINTGYSQVLEPAKWRYKAKGKPVNGEEAVLVFEVALDQSWYIYSTDFINTQGFGPAPTKFYFEPHASYELLGDVISIGSKQKKDELLGLTFKYLDKSPAMFVQKIKVHANNPVIRGHYEYLVCSETDGKCIVGDGEFDFQFTTAD